ESEGGGLDASGDGGGCRGPHLYVNPDNRHCYRFERAQGPWVSAESDCVVWGGHLASIGTAAEQAFVFGVVVGEHDAGQGAAWIGLNRREAGEWRWSTGEPLGYTNWGADSPNDAAVPKDCVVMYGVTY